jgi:hypothetical protein
MSERANALPVSRKEVEDALCARMDRSQKLRAFSKLLAALFHFEFHEELEALKEAYAPINPDCDRREPPSVEEQDACGEKVRSVLSTVLERGNYRPLTEAELDLALEEKSLFPIEVSIDFDVFDDFLVFARGESVREGEVKKWLGLRKKTLDVPTYDRVCLFLRFKPEDALDDKQLARLVGEPGSTVLKLFRNIPKADLEMLFPSTKLKMRLLDKLLIGVPAVVGGVPVIAKLIPAAVAVMILLGFSRGEVNEAAIIAGLSGFAGLGIFLFRQWDKFKSRKVLFMKMLSDNLYFRNIDNNEGVITRLIDEAEEEEHKEAIIAYVILLEEPGLTMDALDERAEAWLRESFDLDVDFEVDDAVDKLLRLELATEREGRYEVIPLDEALRLLDKRWDELFPYNDG